MTAEQEAKQLKERAAALQAAHPSHVNSFTIGMDFGQIKVSEEGEEPEVYKKQVNVILSAFYGLKPVSMIEMDLPKTIALRDLLNTQIDLAMVQIKTDDKLETRQPTEEGTEGRGVQ